MDREGVVRLLEAILASQPKLPGASCIGRHSVFDAEPGNGRWYQIQEQNRVAEAARVCGGCPVRPRCPCPTSAGSAAVGEPAGPGVLPAA